jgi:hypothetical protein
MEKIALVREYKNAQQDAALIAAEVISKRFSSGWITPDPEDKKTAANTERLLALFNIGYDMNGRWVHKVKGSNFFESTLTSSAEEEAMTYFKAAQKILDK